MAGKPNPIHERIRKLGSDWSGEQVVRLGDDSGDQIVETGTDGEYYARQTNGRVIKVRNAIGTSPDFDTRVRVVRSRYQPNIWKIAEVLEDYDTPTSNGRISRHHKQHEESGFDRVALDRKQVKQLSCRAAGGWEVRIYGAPVLTASGVVLVENQTLDLSSYAVTTGAKYVSIEADDDGTLSENEGSPFAAPDLGTEADIPAPDSGKYSLAYVLFYEGQTEIIDENIRAFLPLPGSGLAGSHSHFNDAEGDPEDVSISASEDGTSLYAARRDHVHLYTPGLSSGSGDSHEHKLARWNGALAQTVFELPEFAESIEWITMGGLIEDPFVYTLAADGGTIVLDTGLASAQVLIASYIVRSVDL